MSTKKLTPEQERKAVVLVNGGMSQVDVAKRMGVQRRTIWALCNGAPK